MNLNLDTLKTEIVEYMQSEGFVVFHGYSRLADTDSFVAWDTDRLPDYKAFLSAAKRAGVKLLVYHFREFTAAHLEDASERLDESDVSAEDRRTVERRLRELGKYEGFTCALELSYDLEGRVYLFSLRSEWYDEYLDLIEDLDSTLGEDEDEPGDSMGGYYSRN